MMLKFAILIYVMVGIGYFLVGLNSDKFNEISKEHGTAHTIIGLAVIAVIWPTEFGASLHD